MFSSEKPRQSMAVVAGLPRPMVNPGRPWIRTTFQLISVIPATSASIDDELALIIVSAMPTSQAAFDRFAAGRAGTSR